MEKKRYYVHPVTREILDYPDPGTFSFEIEATDVELAELRNLMAKLSAQDHNIFFDALLPYQDEEANAHNQAYEDQLNTLYQHVYQLGTAETKQELAKLISLNSPETFG